MKISKYLSILAVAVLLSFSVVAQEKLNFQNSSWTNVVPGIVISQPAVTSYGFCVPTDGRMISAFSNDGRLLWDKSTSSSRKIDIYPLPDDFTLLWDSRNSTMKLLNPTGTEIWAKELTYELTKAPFPGRDGRIFVTGNNIVECYGVNGICKWSLETKPQKNIPIQELPDGSIIVFLNETGGKTQGLRISPFGKAIEEITFSGVAKSAATTSEGVFLIFTNGASGLFSIKDGLAKNKWGLQVINQNATLLSSGDTYLYTELSSNKVKLSPINMKNGMLSEGFEIPGINGLNLQIMKFNNNSIFLADNKTCCLYDVEGNELWTALMPDNSGITKWNSVIYTNDNHLVFFMDNWTVNGYLTSQTLSITPEPKKTNYKNYYEIDSYFPEFEFTDTLSRKVVSEERYMELANGNYGEKEIEYTSDILSICSAYLSSLTTVTSGRTTMSIFDKDPYGVESIFKQLALYGTSDSAEYFAKLLSATNNKSYQKILMESVSKCGYDPKGKILQAIEQVLRTADTNDVQFLTTACDAVFSICLFMGRPAFYKRGKEIIKTFLQPQYNTAIQNYAKETFGKIIDLDL